ncbi:MAG TPA: amino acid ABC transporter permease [Candidatus Limnocylindrales bacterium]|nr:amino acid ABC transporter permease [Candidatus Limnocylindrales bacterium]
MTAAVVPIARRRVPARGRIVLAAGFAMLVVVLFATDRLVGARWQPFLEPTSWRHLGQGLLVTLGMGGLALVASLCLGVPLGMARAGLSGRTRWLVAGWIELVRATPVLALLLFVFLGLPRLGVDLDAFSSAVIGLTIYNSAVLAEIVRAGISSIPAGEVDAARALGLSYRRTMRHVVLPQAIARMAPAIVSQLITLVKDTSLAFILGAQELVGFGRSFFTFYGNPIETYLVVGTLFFIICYTLSRLSRRLEARQPAEERVVVLGEEDQIGSA